MELLLRMEALFAAAAAHVRGRGGKLDSDAQLELYGLYSQVMRMNILLSALATNIKNKL